LALGAAFLFSVLASVAAVLVEAVSLGAAPAAFFAVFFVFVPFVFLVGFLVTFPNAILTPAYSTSSSIGPSSDAESTASSSLGSSSSSSYSCSYSYFYFLELFTPSSSEELSCAILVLVYAACISCYFAGATGAFENSSRSGSSCL